MPKTVQLGLRIDADLNEEIEYLSENEGVDKMAWIRRALAEFANRERDSMAQEAVKSYIRLVLDEKKLKEITGFSRIPEDVQKARLQILEEVKREAVKWVKS